MKRIIIDPVTRIEGHAKISLFLDDAGNISDAEFHVVEFRGFEKFCEGRPYSEMPGITPRICGICPVSHLLASAKAGDAIMAVNIPPAADKLRRVMNLAQIIQSHALSFFHLSAPDFLMGWDTPPAKRNVFGLIASNKELARAGIRLRQFGQEIIEILGGKKIHPAWAVPGGVRSPLTEEGSVRIRAWLPEAYATTKTAFELFKKTLDTHKKEIQIFGNFPSLFMGLVDAEGNWEHHGGKLRFTDSSGSVIADQLDPQKYYEYISEAVQPTSYLKSPYYTPLGFPEGMYRVGPLARLNIAEQMGTPKADAELKKFKKMGRGAVTSSFLYHYARLIEVLTAIERVEAYMDDADLLSEDLRADAGINSFRGVGVSEAPRGTLFHDYTVDRDGLLKKVNLIVATGQNNLAMNRTVAQIARHYVRGEDIPEPVLNRIEHGIRCYDPCLSCSTHAVGQMPLHIRLIAPDGKVVREIARGG
ncbi:MAG TPA: Ni/Fe hydrogenase subunit alpha [Candidatus Binatia bacterium]|jgi:NAD-reducing hydrogenase large subunit|nr:Ni/Fe hydrogenase subunit alpha [Candidatus Binatia bacterium]